MPRSKPEPRVSASFVVFGVAAKRFDFTSGVVSASTSITGLRRLSGGTLTTTDVEHSETSPPVLDHGPRRPGWRRLLPATRGQRIVGVVALMFLAGSERLLHRRA